MTPAETISAASARDSMTAEQRNRFRNLGVGFLLLAALVAFVFLRRSGTATFRFTSEQSDTFGVPVTGVLWVAVVVLAAIGVGQLLRITKRWMPLALGLGGAYFVFSFLTWAAAGKTTSLSGLLNNTVGAAVPLILGTMAGILCERSGVINIAIEGLLLSGAFTSTVIGSVTNSWVGMLAGMAIGALLAWLLAWLAIRWKVDQVIAGFAINFLALGLTSYLNGRLLRDRPEWNDFQTVKDIKIPVLHEIPFIGDVFFVNKPLTYVTYIGVFVLTWLIYRTRWGLRTRAIGEHPKAADTLGVKVNKLRYRNVVIAGAIGGLGGCYWTFEVGKFSENITVGLGYIALAAVIIGRWHPVGAMLGALLFAFFYRLNNSLGNLKTGIPSEFLLMLPYLATIVVVAGFVGRSRPPAAGGKPYESQ